MQLTNEQLQKFGVTPQMLELGVSYDGVDLKCENFESFEHHKLVYAISMFDIHGLGGKAYWSIAKHLTVPTDFLLLNQNQDILNKLKIEIGPAKTQILIKGIDAIIANGIPLWKLIICLMVEDCGITISKQFAKYYTKEICEIDCDAYDFKGLTKSVIEELKQNESKLSTIIGKLHASNIFVKFPEKTLHKTSSQNEIFYVMTGSPKEFGFKTKSDFQKTLPDNWTEQKGLDKNTNYLISDDVLSKSSKTAKANKLGIQIVTYDIDPTNI